MAQSNARVIGDFSSLIKGADDAAKSLAQLGMKAAGLANPFNLVTGAVGGMVSGLGKIGLAAMGVEAIGKSAVGMASGLLKGNAALEMTTISFKTLLGSASAADDMIKQLTKFAAATPFELTGLEANTQKLLAFGFSAKDIIPLMTSMGDAIAALGGTQDNLNSLVYVMGQMRGEAHINAGDIMQMVNQGIPALQMLADHYHVTTGEIQQMISKGLIPGKEAVDIFTSGLETKYGGMMVAQSSTFNGMLSNLQDWASATMITLSKPFFEPAKKALAAFLSFVQSPQGVALINRVAADIQLAVDKATAAFVRFEPRIKPIFERLLLLANAIRQQMTPGIITLIPLLERAWTRFEPLALSIWKVYQAVQPMNIAFAVLKGLLTGGLQGGLDAFKDRFALIEGYVRKGLELALAAARKYGGQLLDWAMTQALALEKQMLKWASALVNWVLPQIPKLLGFLMALGGSLINWILGEIPVVTRYLLQMASSFVDWVLPIIPRVLVALAQFGTRVIDWAVAEIPILTAAVLNWASIIVDWVLPQVPKVLNALGRFVTQVLIWVEREVPILTRSFIRWTDILAGWIIPAIPGVISSLEKLAATVINWGLTRLPNIIGSMVIAAGQGIGVNLSGPVNDILLVFNSLVANIKTTLLPAFEQMIGYLATNGLPLFNRLSVFIAGTLIPTVASLAAFAMNVLVPAFVVAAALLGRVFGPALTLIGNLVRNQLLPWLTALWQKFDNKYLGAVQTLASRFGKDLAGGIGQAVQSFKDALPHLENFYSKLEPIVAKAWEVYQAISPLSIAIDVLRGFLTGGVQGGLDAFTGHMTKIGDLAGEVMPKLIDGLTTGIPKVLDWVGDQAPKILEQLGKWGESFGKLVDKVLPPLFKALLTVGEKVLTWIVDKAPDILNKLGEWAGKFGEFAKKAIPILLEKLGDLLTTLMKWLGDKAPDILSGLAEWTGRFVEWLAGLAQRLYPEFVKMVGKIWDWIGEKAPELANKLGDWAGAFLKWVITDFIPGWLTMAPKIEGTILKFIGSLVLKIAGAVAGWTGAMLGWVWDVVRGLPGALWNIVTGIGSWFGNAAGELFRVAGDIGGKILEGIIGAIHDAPGKIWDAVTGIMGSGFGNIVKGVVETVANFFVDLINTPINALNGIINTLRGIELLGMRPFDWIPNLPTLGYLRFATGTNSAPRGVALVGEQGMELIQDAQRKLMLVTQPMLLSLRGGEKIYNNQQTIAMLPNPASAQQIHQMYQNSYSNANSWDNSQHNNNYNLNVQQLPRGYQMSPGMQRVWYGRS